MKTTQPAPATQGETPESEAAQLEFESGHGYPLAVHVEFAKRLERELAEAKREAANSHKVVVETSQTVSEYFKENATLRQQLAQVEKERDAYDKRRIEAIEENQRLTSELAELRLDRDDSQALVVIADCYDRFIDSGQLEVSPPRSLAAFYDANRKRIDAARNQQGEGP